MPDEKSIIQRQVGQVQLHRDLFDEAQKKVFERVMTIADKNPVLDWKKEGHNVDFCLVKGKIEPVKDFCLKVQLLAGLSLEAGEPMVHGDEIAVPVTIKGPDGRTMRMYGGCSKGEVTQGNASGNTRWFHDTLARAQTRAFKNALEAYIGMPFVNLAIKELFGGYEVSGYRDDEPRNVTPEPEKKPTVDKTTLALKKKIFELLEIGLKSGSYSQEDFETWIARLKAARDNYKSLCDHEQTIRLELEARK